MGNEFTRIAEKHRNENLVNTLDAIGVKNVGLTAQAVTLQYLFVYYLRIRQWFKHFILRQTELSC